MHIALKEMTKSDFPMIVDWVRSTNRDFLYQWAGSSYEYPLTVEQMEHQYSRGINTPESGAYLFLIVDLDTDEILGTVQLGKWDRILKEAVVGRFLIHKSADRGKGIGTKALERIVEFGFNELGLVRIKLYVFHFNVQAIRCYEKAGFVRGKVLKDVYRDTKGESWDRIEMTLEQEVWRQACTND